MGAQYRVRWCGICRTLDIRFLIGKRWRDRDIGSLPRSKARRRNRQAFSLGERVELPAGPVLPGVFIGPSAHAGASELVAAIGGKEPLQPAGLVGVTH